MVQKLLYLVLNILVLYRSSFQQETCNQALGLEDGRILDERLTASSEYNNWHGKRYVRLNGKKGAKVWCPKTSSVGEYIQVDLGIKHALTGVATKGRNTTWLQYVTLYYITYGLDGTKFSNFTDNDGNTEIFTGNEEVFKVKYNALYRHVIARYVRLYPLAWERRLCMQMELYGCKVQNCSIDNGGCSEKCDQYNDFQVKCSCFKPGYKLVDGACKDINECFESRPCAQNCHNTNGSFTCSCNSGFKLAQDGRSCDDVDECHGNHTCDQLCINTPGEFYCKCKKGYEFGSGHKTCIDIDECARHTSGCEHNCANTVGSFQCSCKTGYKLALNKKSCEDINECDLGRDKCDQICINKEGSYTCSCRNGYTLSNNSYGCDDIDECASGVSGCSHSCENNRGSYQCRCYPGYRLKLDGKTCEDVDECQNNFGNCQHICQNNVGNYSCSCNAGYRLESDGHHCADIDECKEKALCDLSSTICTNTEPFYRCDCKKGFEPKKDNAGDAISCQRKEM